MTGGREVLGDAEQLLHFGLTLDKQRGERGAHALGAQRQAEVLDHRVDRRAADDGQPPERSVRRVHLGEVGAHHDDHRVLPEPLGEVVAVGLGSLWVGEPGAHRPGFPAGAGVPWVLRARPARHLPPQRQVPLAELPPQRRIPDEDEPHGAPVPAVGREPRQFHRPVEHLIGDRVIPVVAAGVLRPHRLRQVHRGSLRPLRDLQHDLATRAPDRDLR
jgi:hypothetical protein